MKSTVAKTLIIAAAASAVGGCAAYQSERPQLAYFVVPCSTPGAFAAQRASTANDNASVAAQDSFPDNARAAAAARQEAPTCLIAAATGRPYSPGYNGYGYAPYYSHPRHAGSGVGVTFHGGGHRGGHHGGGHRRH